MRNLKFLPIALGATLVITIILYVVFHFIFIDLFVDLWWFQSLKLGAYFWLRLLYKFFLSGGVTVAFFAIFFFHFWIASRYLGLNPRDEVLNNADQRLRFQRFSDMFMSGSVKIYTPISLALAIFVALPFYNQWETSLLYFFGTDSGVTENVYGRDVSFYLLSYPIYTLIQKELLITSSLVFSLVGCALLARAYFCTQSKQRISRRRQSTFNLINQFCSGFCGVGFLARTLCAFIYQRLRTHILWPWLCRDSL